MARMPLAPSLAALVIAGFLASPACAGSREEATLESSCEVLDALAGLHLRSIPPALLNDAQGVAIIPNVIKAGFVVGGRHGRGVMLCRERGNLWGMPVFISLTGGSFGWQAGVESTDLVLVFKTKAGVERVLKGKSKLTLGADLSVAAGPVGRQVEAATDGQLKSEIYAYSRSRGLFAGLSLEGAALLVDHRTTEAYYRAPRAVVLDTVSGRPIPQTPPESKLQLKLTMLSAKGEPLPPPGYGPAPIAPPTYGPAPIAPPPPVVPIAPPPQPIMPPPY